MSFLSTLSSPQSHGHSINRNSKSSSQSYPPSQSTNDTRTFSLKQLNNGTIPLLGTESNDIKSTDSFLRDAQRISTLRPSPSPKSDKSLSSAKYDEDQDIGTQLKSSKLYQDSVLGYDDNYTHQHKFTHGTYKEHHDHNCGSKPHEVDFKHSSNAAFEQIKKLQNESRSRLTNYLLHTSLKWPYIHAILSEKDSRRIFYFMSLNFSFMLVQAFYGYLTDSLGLISDSIHMFFDCLGLGVGLFAAISSKWPPSTRFPFGFCKIESLSGFGNGVFLVLISIEIIIEAIERLLEGRETKRLKELLTVSCLGLAVNLVGMACFGHHGHSGHGCGEHTHIHDHSHSHNHSHNHDHSHSHSHDHSHSHNHDHSHDFCHGYERVYSHSVNPQNDSKFGPYGGHLPSEQSDFVCNKNLSPGKLSQRSSTIPSLPTFRTNSQIYSHEDDNLHGIFLHILADTMGSAAVIVSTTLIYLTGFDGWDPIASCIIAILIFISAIPLIKSSAKKLLLTLPDDKEYTLRDILSSVSELHGVSNYYAPRFWLVDTKIDGENQKINGVIHIIAVRGSDLNDLRKRTQQYFKKHNLDVVVQIENDNDLNCWCGDMNTNYKPSMHDMR